MKIGYLMQEGGPDVRKLPLTGPANHVLKIYRELQAGGHEMRLLARYDGQILISADLERFEPVEVKKTDLGLRRQLESALRGIQSRLRIPYLNLFESLRFAEACRQELGDRDLFYERMGWMGYGAGLAAQRMHIPLVLEVNNGDFITELERLGVAPQGFQRWLAIRLMQAAVGRGSHIVATGDGHRQRFIEWWQVDPSRVTTVENGSELVGLLSREQLASFCEQPNDQVAVTLVFVGAFEPWHGILILLAALARAVDVNPNLHLILIGSGTLENEVKEQIEELGVTQHITLTGQLGIRQVADRLSMADIGVAPYCGWMEFSGLKLFDYKAAGLAIIATGKDGQPATLTDGETALIVPPCDEDALADAILKLAADRALRRRLGQKARLEAEQYHTWQHTTRQLEAIFNEVLARN